MSLYDSNIKKAHIPLYNNIMNGSQIFKLEQVNVNDLFNNDKKSAIFVANIEKLDGTSRGKMIEELECLERLLASYFIHKDIFNLDEFSKDANYRIEINGNKHTFFTKSTNIQVITTVDVLGNSKRTGFFVEKVRNAKESLLKMKKLGKEDKTLNRSD